MYDSGLHIVWMTCQETARLAPSRGLLSTIPSIVTHLNIPLSCHDLRSPKLLPILTSLYSLLLSRTNELINIFQSSSTATFISRCILSHGSTMSASVVLVL